MRTPTSRNSTKPGTGFMSIVLSLMLGGLSLLFLMQWRVARTKHTVVSNGLKQAVGSLQKQLEAHNGQLRAVLAHLVDPAALVHSERRSGNPRVRETRQESDLPSLPEDLNCEGLVRSKELKDLFLEPALNPEGREYHRDAIDVVSGTRLQGELEQAKAEIRILDSQILVRMTESMDQLRAEGKFVVYEDDEPFKGMDGVLTSAEHRKGGGSRLFYYYPVDFPELYDMQEQRKEVAERALRRIASILSAPPPKVSQDAEG